VDLNTKAIAAGYELDDRGVSPGLGGIKNSTSPYRPD
jgi:hypothetical protein